MAARFRKREKAEMKDKIKGNEETTYESHEIWCETEMTDPVKTYLATSCESQHMTCSLEIIDETRNKRAMMALDRSLESQS